MCLLSIISSIWADTDFCRSGFIETQYGHLRLLRTGTRPVEASGRSVTALRFM